MPRAIWSGAISFGLVNVPVKLYSAVSHKEVAFHMLHKKDGARIRQMRVCSAEDEEVAYEDIAKGYELSPGRYVMLEKQELEALRPKGDKTIAIEDFVQQEDIDPIYYEGAYHLVPDKGAARAYQLLLEAMRATGKVGIARLVLRTRQYLCAVRPTEEGLTLSTMLFSDEVNAQGELAELPGKEAKPKERELQMAQQLIESLAAPFEPDKYKDEYRERVLELIEKKSQGEEIVAPEEAQEAPKVVNLMDALQASIRALEKGPPKGERRHRAEAAKRARGGEKNGGGKGAGNKKRKSA
jgi:DNA end-binding protein Ku